MLNSVYPVPIVLFGGRKGNSICCDVYLVYLQYLARPTLEESNAHIRSEAQSLTLRRRKMYISRFGKWGYNKNNRKGDMLFVLNKKAKRDAMGKKSEFVVRGRLLTEDDIHQYLSRTKESAPVLDDTPQTPAFITYRTPPSSPQLMKSKPSTDRGIADHLLTYALSTKSKRSASHCSTDSGHTSGALTLSDGSVITYLDSEDARRIFTPNSEMSPQPSSPKFFGIPEELFFNIDLYFDASFQSGKWMLDEKGICVSTVTSRTDDITTFIDACRTAGALVKARSFVEARKMLSRACNLVRDILEREDPRTIAGFCDTFNMLLRDGHVQIVNVLKRYISEMATIILRERANHPWFKVWHLLGMVEMETIADVTLQSWKCTSTALQNNVGRYTKEAVDCYIDYIQGAYTSDNATTNDYVAEESLLRSFLQECLQVFEDPREIPSIVVFNLGINLNRQGRFAEAEVLAKNILMNAQFRIRELGLIEGPIYTGLFQEEIRGYFLQARAQYWQGKFDVAEKNVRAAIACADNMEGANNPFSVNKRVLLESWLREWGRDADADAVKAYNDSLLSGEDTDSDIEELQST